MTNFQQKIYNDHLAISRKMRDKPFHIRKNFDDMEQDKIDTLKKLEKMFSSYDSINIDDFFMAPYVMFEDEDYFDLDFFTTQKAKKVYTQYMKKIEMDDPDSKESLERFVKGFRFIKIFCQEKGLTLQEYPVYIESNLPCILQHLKNHDINMYCLHALGITKLQVDNRMLNFIFSDFWLTFQKTKNKFYMSKKMKEITKQIIDKLEK